MRSKAARSATELSETAARAAQRTHINPTNETRKGMGSVATNAGFGREPQGMMVHSMSLRLSVLDQSPISHGMTVGDALRNTVDLARFVDGLGFTRYWLAEHHGTVML